MLLLLLLLLLLLFAVVFLFIARPSSIRSSSADRTRGSTIVMKAINLNEEAQSDEQQSDEKVTRWMWQVPFGLLARILRFGWWVPRGSVPT